MKGKNRVILHIVVDSYFLTSAYSRFNLLKGYEHIFVSRKLGAPKTTFSPTRDKVLYPKTMEEFNSYFSLPEVDIILFHGLFSNTYQAYKYIPKDKIVVWWIWGADIYEPLRQVSPLLRTNLYKKYTKKTLSGIYMRLLYWLSPIYGFIGNRDRKKLISRVDYCFSALEIEQELLRQQVPQFNAKSILYKGIKKYKAQTFTSKTESGYIMIGHSSVPYDNQLDCIKSIENFDLRGRKIVFILNRGFGFWGRQLMKYTNIGGGDVTFLTELMPKGDFFNYVNQFSHAIMGNIRSAGMSTIFAFLCGGVKLFMYEDSHVYRQLKKDGFVLFSIEHDLNQNSLNTPLAESDAQCNFNLYMKIHNFRDKEESEEYLQSEMDNLTCRDDFH